MQALDVIIPVYREQADVVRQTVLGVQKAFNNDPNVTVLVVNDGTPGDHGLDGLASIPGVQVVHHDRNQGYGTALKSGILSGSAPWIAITDADGTYPVAELKPMADLMESHDMVIGMRAGATCKIPMLRRFPKAMLNRLSSYLAGETIRDLNSGMRIFNRDLCYSLWGLFPRGFSFTSTITMGGRMGGFRVHDHPIDYFERVGKSSIKPIQDTLRFFKIVCKMGLIFAPMKLFGPVALFLLGVGLAKGLLQDYWHQGHVGILAAVLMISAVQIFMMGLIGELIVHNRSLTVTRRPSADQLGSSRDAVASVASGRRQ